MAFFNKVGAASRQNISGISGRSAMLNAVRCISSKLFVGRLSHGTDDHLLKEAFSRFGEVAEARILMDRDTGRSRGVGFVTFVDDRSATSAIAAMDGKELPIAAMDEDEEEVRQKLISSTEYVCVCCWIENTRGQRRLTICYHNFSVNDAKSVEQSVLLSYLQTPFFGDNYNRRS